MGRRRGGQRFSADRYTAAAKAVNKPIQFKPITATPEFDAAIRYATETLHAFPWDLAFPEVFCDETDPKPGGGFDAFIGNPPYEVLSLKESGFDPTALKTFVPHEPTFAAAIRGKQNLYTLFTCRVLDLLRDRGRFGFIVPMPLLGDDQAADVRRLAGIETVTIPD